MRDAKKRIHVKKQQVVVIGGGETYRDDVEYYRSLVTTSVNLDQLRTHKSWKGSLQERLGDKYDVLIPRMPCKENAKMDEWETYFDHVMPLLFSNVIFVGHSLGGIFLAAYLSSVRRDYKAAIFIAAPFEADTFFLPEMLQVPNAHIFHSTDDPVVSFADNSYKYRVALQTAKMHNFSDRGHFNQEEFPELVELIKSL